jgi:hypothetical protein
MIHGPQPQISLAHARQASASQPLVATIYKEVSILTDVDILAAGLHYAGFDARRQGKVNLNRNMTRYKQFFGVDPSTAAPLFRDLRNKYPSFKYKDGLMTINWLFLNDKQSVLSGRWGYCEEYIGPTVKEYATMIQSLKSRRSNLFLGIRNGSKPALTAPTLSPMSFARIQVANGLTTKATPVAWYVFAVCLMS